MVVVVGGGGGGGGAGSGMRGGGGGGAGSWEWDEVTWGRSEKRVRHRCLEGLELVGHGEYQDGVIR